MSETIQQPRPTTPADVSKGAEYIVLRLDDLKGGVWTEVKAVAATSADAAIRKAVNEDAGKYVAVPMRSWQPRTLTVKTEKRTVLS